MNNDSKIRSVTSKEVARLAGVSQTTVSRVLNARMDVSIPVATRERVFEAARRLRYRPNRSAATMRTREFNTFGLLNSTSLYKSMIPMGLLHGIQDVLDENGIHLLVSQHTEQQLADAQFVPLMLKQLMLDGLIVNYQYDPPKRLLQVIEEHNIPSVFVNNDLPYNCVRPHDLKAAYDATMKLIQLGHERIAFVGMAQHTHYSTRHRAQGYKDAMIDAGLAPNSMMLPLSAMMPIYDAITGPDRPTAVLAGTDFAVPAYAAALKAGLRVPDDLSIVGFEQDRIDGYEQLFTYYRIPSHAAGSAVATMLRRRVEEPDINIPTQLIEFEFVEGGTCAPPTR